MSDDQDQAETATKTVEERLALVEHQLAVLVEELKRHVSLRLPEPPAAPPADTSEA